MANPRLSDMARALWASRKGGQRVIFGASNKKTEELGLLRELIEAGQIRSVIDRSYPFEQIPEAHRYVDTGQKRGNVVIAVA